MSECLTHTYSTQPPDQKENGLLIEEIWKSHLMVALTGRRQPLQLNRVYYGVLGAAACQTVATRLFNHC